MEVEQYLRVGRIDLKSQSFSSLRPKNMNFALVGEIAKSS